MVAVRPTAVNARQARAGRTQRDVLRGLLAELGTRGGPTAHGLPADLSRLGKGEADQAITRLRELLLG
jgi:hypothetical protein